MIGLTHYRTACTEDLTLIEDLKQPQRAHFFADTYKNASVGVVYPPHKMADKVLDPELLRHLRDNPVEKSAFILASGNAHFAGINPIPRPRTQLTYAYRILPMTLTQVYAGRIAQMCGATDHISTDSTACASSMKVMMDVKALIEFYGFDRVCVLAVEDAVCNLTLGFFSDLNVSILAKDDDAGRLPSAFDSKNGGFHIGQGAAFCVFEANADNAHAYLNGAFTAGEKFNNQIGQSEDGSGFVKAINGALKSACMGADQVGIVKTHGTGTEMNNQAEKAALHNVFGNDFVATSFKPTIGHTLGTSGLLETCLLVDSLKTGIVPAIKNRTEDDAIFLSNPTKATGSTFLSLAAGMGNVYSAGIFTMGVR